jgi:hypothetical protein
MTGGREASRRAPRLLVPVAAALLLGGMAPAARQTTFRAGVQTVALYATVSDREGRLMPDLEREAFEVRDDGRPAPITAFSNEIQIITVAVMLDMSNSMVDKVLQVRKSALCLGGAALPNGAHGV